MSADHELSVLGAFLRRLEDRRGPADRAARLDRDAARLGVDVDAWSELARAPLDLAWLRAAHRALVGTRTAVRRARADGRWDLAPPGPGRWRTRPQALRVDDHVEPAWAPGTLRRRLGELLVESSAEARRAPVAAAARLVHALCRAQPFVGDATHLALVAGSRLFVGLGLPIVPAVELERDRGFRAALVARGDEALPALSARLALALWDEALLLSEARRSRAVAPTLRDEHGALVAARATARRDSGSRLEDAVSFVSSRLPGALAERLGLEVGPGASLSLATWAERLALARAAEARGRILCPHEPMVGARFDVPAVPGLAALLVGGSVGDGTSGATAVHVALAVGDLAETGPAPGRLLVPDEDDADRRERLGAWLPVAVGRVMHTGPRR